MDNVDTLQFRERINQRRNEGRPLTDDEIQCITNESTDLAGAAASVNHPEQVRWAAKAEQVLSKPANKITQDDAKNVTSKETRAFENLPATGSVASHVQSMAEKNTGKHDI